MFLQIKRSKMGSKSITFNFSPWPFLLFVYLNVTTAQNTTTLANVGMVLDMEKTVAKLGLRSVGMALSEFYASHPDFKTRVALHVRDSTDNVVRAAAAAADLIKNVQVEAIIGPITSAEAEFIVKLGEETQVPIISYSATSPLLPSTRSSYFIRACQNDMIQAQAISAVIKKFGWRKAIPVYEDNEFGHGMIPSLVDALQQIDTRIPYRSVISPSATDDQIVKELHKLKSTSTRVFIVHITPSLGSRLFNKAKEIGMMSREDCVWILTNGMTNELGSLDDATIESMQGVLGVKTFVPHTKERHEFVKRWKKRFPGEELNVYGLWAYDTATALARAIEKVGIQGIGFEKKTDTTVANTTMDGFANLGVSKSGKRLHKAILHTNFSGLSGDFNLLHGQLNTGVFEIVNVIGVGWKSVGFWTPESGLVSTLIGAIATNTTTDRVTDSASISCRRKLGTIIWPGDDTAIPKGFVSLASSDHKPTTMRVLVPSSSGFDEFLKVKITDPKTNRCNASGFSIDVFNNVMEAALPDVQTEFFCYDASYDQVIKQMDVQKYNACAGDITIRANRFDYAEFTQPYSESGVSMVVRADSINKSDFFVKVVTWQLAACTMGLFLLNAIVIWTFEHKYNKHFQRKVMPDDTPRPFFFFIVDQVVESLYFSFSMMFFVQRQTITSNWTRFVMVIWFFVFLILAQSYTASMSSYLSAQQLVPKFTNLEDLRDAGFSVGYQSGSFVYKLLIRDKSFNASKLIPYKNLEQMSKFLSNGTEDGTSVAAVVDELPFLRLFLAKHSNDYIMVDSVRFDSDGFGFAFPIGTSYPYNLSKAIVRDIENKFISRTFKYWIDKSSTCSDYQGAQYNSYQLDLAAFRTLFIISVCASSAGIIWYLLVWWCVKESKKQRWKHQNLESAESGGSVEEIQLCGRRLEPPDHSSTGLQALTQRPRRDEASENVPVSNYDVSASGSPLTRTQTFPSYVRGFSLLQESTFRWMTETYRAPTPQYD